MRMLVGGPSAPAERRRHVVAKVRRSEAVSHVMRNPIGLAASRTRRRECPLRPIGTSNAVVYHR